MQVRNEISGEIGEVVRDRGDFFLVYPGGLQNNQFWSKDYCTVVLDPPEPEPFTMKSTFSHRYYASAFYQQLSGSGITAVVENDEVSLRLGGKP